jgi:hypothetical protein
VEVVAKRINDKKKFDISQQTRKELTETMVDVGSRAKVA